MLSQALPRRRFLSASLGAIASATLPPVALRSPDVQAAVLVDTATRLEENAAAWHVTLDCPRIPKPCPSFPYQRSNVATPSLDGIALAMGPQGGGSPGYVSPHYYRTMPLSSPVPPHAVRGFELTLSYYYTDVSYGNCPVVSKAQALEFGVSLRTGLGWWEWAVQWTNVGTNSSQCPSPETRWRLWTADTSSDAAAWAFVADEQVAPYQWHFLRLKGDIAQGDVRYLELQHDNRIDSLAGHIYGAKVADPLEELAVEFQPDANATNDAYDFVVDQVRLNWYTRQDDFLPRTQPAGVQVTSPLPAPLPIRQPASVSPIQPPAPLPTSRRAP